MRIRSLAGVFLFASSIVIAGCIPMAKEYYRFGQLSEEEQSFLRLPHNEQIPLFKKMPLERQVDFFVKDVKHRHHTNSGFGWEVAKSDEKAIPLLQKALEHETAGRVRQGLVSTLGLILKVRDVDFRDNIELMDLLERIASEDSLLKERIDEIVMYKKS